jgi:hypothetical protein
MRVRRVWSCFLFALFCSSLWENDWSQQFWDALSKLLDEIENDEKALKP